MLMCKKCKQIFASVKEFFSHIKTHHSNIIQIQCPYVQCSRLYSNQLSLKSHLKNPALHLNERNSESNSAPPDDTPLDNVPTKEETQCTLSRKGWR